MFLKKKYVFCRAMQTAESNVHSSQVSSVDLILQYYYIPVLLFALITLFRPCAITVTLPVQCLLFIINDNDV